MASLRSLRRSPCSGHTGLPAFLLGTCLFPSLGPLSLLISPSGMSLPKIIPFLHVPEACPDQGCQIKHKTLC